MTYTTVKNPKWTNHERDKINCTVKFDHLKNEVQFTASPDDCTDYGPEIFHRCLSGEFGEIAPPGNTKPQKIKYYGAPTDLKKILPGWPEVIEFLEEANFENASGSIRGSILVWGSMIEKILGEVIASFLVPRNHSEKIIWERGPFSGFHNRIEATYALGLISEGEKTACNSVKQIRNAAAHNWKISLDREGFYNKNIQKEFKTLYSMFQKKTHHWIEEDIAHLVRSYYCGSCAVLALQLERRVQDARNEQRRGVLNSIEE